MTKKLDVEKVRGEISHHISPVIGWLRMDASKGRVDTDESRHKAWLERLGLAAEAIVKMAEGEPEYEYNILESYSVFPDNPGALVSDMWMDDLERVEELVTHVYLPSQLTYINAFGKAVYTYSIVRREKAEQYEIIKSF